MASMRGFQDELEEIITELNLAAEEGKLQQADFLEMTFFFFKLNNVISVPGISSFFFGYGLPVTFINCCRRRNSYKMRRRITTIHIGMNQNQMYYAADH